MPIRPSAASYIRPLAGILSACALLALGINAAEAASANDVVTGCHYSDKIPKSSKDAAETVLKRDKNSMAAWLCLGRWHAEQKQLPVALQSLKKAEQLSLKQDEAELNLIHRYLKDVLGGLPAQGSYRDDYNYYSTEVARADQQNVAAVQLCRKELKAEHFDAAINAMTPLWWRNTHLSEANLCLGRAFYAKGDSQTALAFFQILERLPTGEDNGSEMAWHWLSQTYRRLGNSDAALDYGNKSLSEARRRGDRDSEATDLNNIALIYADKGDKRRAITYYEQSLALMSKDEDKAPTWNNLALLYHDEGDNAKAIELMQQALNAERRAGRKQGMAVKQLNLGQLYQSTGKLDQAEKLITAGLAGVQQLGAKDWEITGYQYLAWLRESQGRTNDYREALQKALAIAQETGNQIKVKSISKELAEASDTK